MDEPLDSIVSSVIDKFTKRSQMGYLKYGTNLDRTDLSIQEWIQHAQEELMDGILYLEKMKTYLQPLPPTPPTTPTSTR